MAMPLWLKEKLFQKTLLRDEMKKWQPDFDWQKRLLFGEHHQSHAASAFSRHPMRRPRSCAWTASANGRPRRSASAGQQARDAEGDPLPALARAALFGLHLLHRLQGQFRRVQGDGARAYGEPKFKDTILNNIVDLKEDGTFRLDQSYFDYCTACA